MSRLGVVNHTEERKGYHGKQESDNEEERGAVVQGIT